MADTTFYDRYWKTGLHDREGWDQDTFDRMLGLLKGLPRVLDYGCGLGHKYRAFLADSVGEYIGADISQVALTSVQDDGYTAAGIAADTSKTQLPSEYCDGAVCSEVLEHLFDPLLAAREIYRVLKPGASLVVTVPNFGYLPWRICAALRARVPDEPENPTQNPFNGVHIRYFSRSSLTRLLNMAGFRDVYIDPYTRGSIWDVFMVLGPLHHITILARRYLPEFFHLRFLADWFPGLFAERMRAVCRKPRLQAS